MYTESFEDRKVFEIHHLQGGKKKERKGELYFPLEEEKNSDADFKDFSKTQLPSLIFSAEALLTLGRFDLHWGPSEK